jgi:hypothetical protein
MKVENKPVYIAEDGKEFTDEAACKAYETELAKTTYWRVVHSPDLTEGRGHYGLSLFKFMYGGYMNPEEHMMDFCYKRFGNKVEFVQGASEIRSWMLERVQSADFERKDQSASVGCSRTAAKKFRLQFGKDNRLEVAEEIKE